MSKNQHDENVTKISLTKTRLKCSDIYSTKTWLKKNGQGWLNMITKI